MRLLVICTLASQCLAIGEALAAGPPRLVGCWDCAVPGSAPFTAGDIATAPDGTLYVCDPYNARVVHFTGDGALLGQWGTRGFNPGQLMCPTGLAVDDWGFVYVADCSRRIQKFTADGGFVFGFTDAHIYSPAGIALDQRGCIFVANLGTGTVAKFSLSGEFLMEFPPARAEFEPPGARGVYVDWHGCVFVISDHVVQRFWHDGTLITQWTIASGRKCMPFYPSDILGDSEGYVLIAAGDSLAVQRYSHELDCVDAWPAPPPPASRASSNVRGLALDKDWNLYVTDTDGRRVCKYRYEPPRANHPATWGELKAFYR